MMSSPKLIWITVAVVGVCHAVVLPVRSMFEPGPARAPNADLATLPYEIAGWTGSDRKIEDRLFDAIGAVQTMNREYRAQDGRLVSVHIAVFDTSSWTPHEPEICYPAAGWTSIEGHTRNLPLNDASVRLTRFSHDTQVVRTLHWFQLGPETYVDREAARPVARGLRGQKESPPVVKVLMQTAATGDDQDVQTLCELADPIYEFTSTL